MNLSAYRVKIYNTFILATSRATIEGKKKAIKIEPMKITINAVIITSNVKTSFFTL